MTGGIASEGFQCLAEKWSVAEMNEEALQASVVLSSRELCYRDCVGRVVTNVAFYYVTMKPNSQKNDIRCEHRLEIQREKKRHV